MTISISNKKWEVDNTEITVTGRDKVGNREAHCSLLGLLVQKHNAVI